MAVLARGGWANRQARQAESNKDASHSDDVDDDDDNTSEPTRVSIDELTPALS